MTEQRMKKLREFYAGPSQCNLLFRYFCHEVIYILGINFILWNSYEYSGCTVLSF